MAHYSWGFWAIILAGRLPQGSVWPPLILGKVDDANCWLGSADFMTEAERKGTTHILALRPFVLVRDGLRETGLVLSQFDFEG